MKHVSPESKRLEMVEMKKKNSQILMQLDMEIQKLRNQFEEYERCHEMKKELGN